MTDNSMSYEDESSNEPVTVPERPSGLWGLIQLLFGIREEVNQRVYAIVGLTLMVVKYLVEAGMLWRFNETIYTPVDFLNPLLTARQHMLTGAPDWLGWAWLLWSFPFLWIAISMSVRRSVNAGHSPWVGMLILIPVINLVVMISLALVPGRPHQPLYSSQECIPALDQIWAAWAGLLMGSAVALAMLALSVYAFRTYGASLFFGTPVLMGTIASVVYNIKTPRSYSASISLGITTVILVGGLFLLFALEGIICIAMAAPIALPLGGLGGLLGKIIANTTTKPIRGTAAMFVLLPGWAGVESFAYPQREFQVTSSVIVNAPVEQVWETVIHFPEIPEPKEWYFRMGIAYPIRGEIFGTGPGAVRHCVFSTGTFVEPITVWDAPRRLAFNVAEQPHPMFELSPYKHVHPPHLDGTLRSTHGEFVLTSLPGDRTQLVGHTWYEFEMYPQTYWTFWSHLMIHRIHQRVLDHIKVSTEMNSQQ